MMAVNSRHLGVKAIGLGNGLDKEVKEREMLKMTPFLTCWGDGGICHFLVKGNMKRSRFGVDEGTGQGGKS